jgi:porin
VPDGSIAASLPKNGDPLGWRAALYDKGIKFNLFYIGETFGNPIGGKEQGAIYEDRFQALIDIDTNKLVGWKDGLIHFDLQQIDGAGLSRYFVGNLNTVSYIEALHSSRLYEAYFDQHLFDGKIAVHIGQLGADNMFIISSYAQLMINSTFGFPQFAASNLPGGGAAYPLATPGVSVKLNANDNLTILAAVFNGDPADPAAADPQLNDRWGVNFRVEDPPTIFAEGQYRYNTDKNAFWLPGTLKVGIYDNLMPFPEGVFTPVAPLNYSGNAQGVYAVLDQQIYRLSASAPDKGIGLFVRGSVSPEETSVVDYYIDSGLNFSGLVPGRSDDSFGVGAAFTHISAAAREQDMVIAETMPGYPIRNYEATIEATYQVQVMQGFTVQPDFQYSIHPGANAPNPDDPLGRPIPNAAIFGLRASLSY